MSFSPPKVLLLSAYDTPSHRYWRTSLQQLDDIEWCQLALPARYFAWRLRGNSISWGMGDYPELDESYDLVIATSMVDITALRGFRPKLAHAPLIVYFHENQFDYPVSEHQQRDIQLQLTTIYNAACADCILFNSEYNRKTFVRGATALLKKMPDEVPKHLMTIIEKRSQVLPVPINESPQSSLHIDAHQTLHILWNHRWEYDKNPEVFFTALTYLQQNQVPFTLDVIGQKFRNAPKVFEHAFKQFSDHIRRWGFQPRNEYHQALKECNLVVSTSLHDFQGLALQEAIANGCIPVVPNRVAYPEYIPEDLRYEGNAENEADELARKLMHIWNNGYQLPDNPVEGYTWSKLKQKYQQVFQQVMLSNKV